MIERLKSRFLDFTVKINEKSYFLGLSFVLFLIGLVSSLLLAQNSSELRNQAKTIYDVEIPTVTSTPFVSWTSLLTVEPTVSPLVTGETNQAGNDEICSLFEGVASEACIDRHHLRYFCVKNNATLDVDCPDQSYCANGKCLGTETGSLVTVSFFPPDQPIGVSTIAPGGDIGAEVVVGSNGGLCYCKEVNTQLTYVCERQSLCCDNVYFQQSTKGKQVCVAESRSTQHLQSQQSLQGLYLQTDKDLIVIDPNFTHHGCGPTSLYNACVLSGNRDCHIGEIASEARLTSEGTYLNNLINISEKLIGPSDFLFAVETEDGTRYAQTINQPMNSLDSQISSDLQRATEAGNLLLATLKVTQPNGQQIDHIVLINHCDENGCVGVDSYYNQDRTVNYTGQVYQINFSEWGENANLEQVVVIQKT